MERKFDSELKSMSDKLINMASLIEKMIDNAVAALEEGKGELTEKVYGNESEVNRDHVEVDEMCLKMLALRQPIAKDLRLITSAMKINSELERMGDQAVNIAQNTQMLLKNKQSIQLAEIPKMAEITRVMVKDSIDSFVKKDVELAKSVLVKDDEVDELKKNVFKDCVGRINKESLNTESVFDLILISRNLERIGDHATNICEDVIFLVSGEDVRHHLKDFQPRK